MQNHNLIFTNLFLCQKDRLTFGKILFFLLVVFTVSCLFWKTKKSSMATVCNNRGADLKERSVCRSPASLWSAAETQRRSQSSSVIFVCDVICQSFPTIALRSKPPRFTWRARTSLGTRLAKAWNRSARAASRKQLTDNWINFQWFSLSQCEYKTFWVHMH